MLPVARSTRHRGCLEAGAWSSRWRSAPLRRRDDRRNGPPPLASRRNPEHGQHGNAEACCTNSGMEQPNTTPGPVSSTSRPMMARVSGHICPCAASSVTAPSPARSPAALGADKGRVLEEPCAGVQIGSYARGAAVIVCIPRQRHGRAAHLHACVLERGHEPLGAGECGAEEFAGLGDGFRVCQPMGRHGRTEAQQGYVCPSEPPIAYQCVVDLAHFWAGWFCGRAGPALHLSANIARQ